MSNEQIAIELVKVYINNDLGTQRLIYINDLVKLYYDFLYQVNKQSENGEE